MSRRNIFRNISPESDEARQAALEGEVPELGPDFFKRGRIRIGKLVLREAQGTLTKRGRPPIGSGPKVQQSLRLSPEVLEHFRTTGPGWQARIDEVLKRHVKMVEEMRREVAEARDAGARVAEERSGYDAGERMAGEAGEEKIGYATAAPPSIQEGAAAVKQPRRHKPRREWKKPTVRPMRAGDAEAVRGRWDASLAS